MNPAHPGGRTEAMALPHGRPQGEHQGVRAIEPDQPQARVLEVEDEVQGERDQASAAAVLAAADASLYGVRRSAKGRISVMKWNAPDCTGPAGSEPWHRIRP